MNATTTATVTRTMVQCRGLVKDHHVGGPATRVLDGIDLTVDEGEFLAVMGASGSGKSTLLHAISGMDRPTGGTVVLDGQDLTTLDDAAMSHLRLTTMGFVFQQAHFLDNLSIRDNILLPVLKATPRAAVTGAVARVDRLMEQMGISALAGHGTTEVSGGQLQRASICRALAPEPRIVFADEPTGALNSTMTDEVMDELTRIHRDGTTLAMVTHDSRCAARADRVVYLRDGSLVDTCHLGRWDSEVARGREDHLLRWLTGHGF